MRLIDADALKEDINVYFADSYRLIDTIVERIEAMPTIERKTGKWIDETFEPWGLVYHPYKCNQCGEHSEANSNYCPNCGADMRGREDEQADV